jgi:hypothetical protein
MKKHQTQPSLAHDKGDKSGIRTWAMCAVSVAALGLLGACGGGGSTSSGGDISNITGTAYTACVYDQYAGGGGARRCTNQSRAVCNGSIFGGNQVHYQYSTCAQLGF